MFSLRRRSLNIFIVDDNKLFSLTLKADLENNFVDMPIQIRVFETGEKFMEPFKEEQPQVVILEYFLNSKYPEALNGIQVLDWINTQNNKTKVIMLTSEDNIDVALKSFHHGAFDYVVKTETKFKTINYSLLNLLKMAEAEAHAKNYKRILTVLFWGISLFVGVAIAMQVLLRQE
jgi:two-component system OmpR family response regulator